MPTIAPAVPVYAGDTLSVEYRFRDSAGLPVDLSVWTFTAQWRVNVAGETAIPFTVDVSGVASGVLRLSMTSAQTQSMTSSGVFDVQGIDGVTVRTFVRSATVFEGDVTRG
jgi:hypothetical protein